jgi:hypothetical protein
MLAFFLGMNWDCNRKGGFMSALSWISKISGELGNKLSQVLQERKPRPKGESVNRPPRVEELEARRMLTTVSITQTSPATEGGDPATFALSCDYTGAGSITVDYHIDYGTATSPDITGYLSGTVSFTALASSAIITVVPVDDNIPEATETFTVSLSGSSITFSPSTSCLGTIIDNDTTEVNVTATDDSAAEADEDTGMFTLSRSSSNISQPLTVYYSVGGTATPDSPWDDYFPIGNQVTFPAGVTEVDIYVRPHNDAASESNETVVLNLLNPPDSSYSMQYQTGSLTSATCTIANNADPDAIIFKSISLGGDRVVSAKDVANGMLGGTKTVKVEMGEGTATLTISRTAGSTGSAKFIGAGGSEVDTLTVSNGDIFTIKGGEVSDTARNMRIHGQVDGDEEATGDWDFTVFRIDLSAYHDTTDTVNANATSAASRVGNMNQFATKFFGGSALGYLAQGAGGRSRNGILVEGVVYPTGMNRADFDRISDGSGFDFKRTITKREYKNNAIITSRSKNDEDDDIDPNGSDINFDEDLLADPQTRSGVTSLYLYDLDFPGLDITATIPGTQTNVYGGVATNDTIRRRSNFVEWIQYGGVNVSLKHNWWEAQSLTATSATTATRNNDFDYNSTTDDDTDDNNVGWDAKFPLTADPAGPGQFDHFEVTATPAWTIATSFIVTVVAVDNQGNIIEDFSGDVSLAQVGGTAGSDGEDRIGVWILGTAGTADDHHVFDGFDSGAWQFSVADYNAETITKFTASGGGKTGDSGAVVVSN